MMALNNLYVVLGAKTSGFHSEIVKAEKALKRFGNGARDIDRAVEKLNRSFTLLGAAASAGFGLAAKAGMDFNSKMQQAEISFTTMLGSAQKAKALLGDLQKLAAKTPFEFPELADATKRMLAYGFAAEKILPTLKAVGDAAAGLGHGSEGVNRIVTALGQMQAKSKVSAEEMRQLTEAGVPAWDILSKAIGKTTAETMKLAEKGVIPAEAAVDALVRGMAERFPDMMDKQSKSFAGLMSTLKDTANMAFGKVLRPAFDWLTTTALPRAVELTERFTNTLEEAGAAAAFKTILPPALVDGITGLFNFIVRNGDAVKAVLAGVASGLAVIELRLLALKVLAMFSWLTTPLGMLVGTVAALTTGFVLLASRTTDTYNAMDDLRRGVAAVALEGENATHIMAGFGRAVDEVTRKSAGLKVRNFGSVEEYVATEFGTGAAKPLNLSTPEKWGYGLELWNDIARAGAMRENSIEQRRLIAESAGMADEADFVRWAQAMGRVIGSELIRASEEAAARLGLAQSRLMTSRIYVEQQEAAALVQEENIARLQMALGRVAEANYLRKWQEDAARAGLALGRLAVAWDANTRAIREAELEWQAFKASASDTITAVLEGSKSLGETIEGIFRGKAHDSIKKFVDNALDSFHDLRKQGENIFEAIAKAVKTNFSALDVFGAMGIGATAGGAIGGNATGAGIGAVIGAVVGTIVPVIGAKLGSILGGFLGGFFGDSSDDEDEYKGRHLDRVAETLKLINSGSWFSGAGLIALKEQLGLVQDNMANALAGAFDADSYEGFVAGFGENLESVTKKALITAFMASETIKPLLDKLSSAITAAVADGELTASERQTIVDLYKQITDQSEGFYAALQDLGIATEDVAGSMTALGEALRNVPTGFKIATARWDVALPKYHSGGYVPEDGPALLRKGEVVLTPEQQRMGGLAINVTVQNAYGFADFKRAVKEAVAEGARSVSLASHGLATGGVY